MTNSLVQVVCNATLQRYGGDLYVGVMTIINSLREVFTMPIQGLNNGAQPVIGYNYGAGLYSRVRRSIRFSVSLTVLYSAAFWAAAMLLPGLILTSWLKTPGGFVYNRTNLCDPEQPGFRKDEVCDAVHWN
mgnify:CR=1 FL=1